MKRFLTFIFLVVVVAGCGNVKRQSNSGFRWSEEKANAWYDSLPWIKGFNYVPSYAGNTTEWWENPLDTMVIGRELGWAHNLGYSSTRVFLQYIVWKKDPEQFRKNFELFLKLAEASHITVVPTLFDDCAFGEPPQLDPYLGKQRDVIPGMILSTWTPSPGKLLGTDSSEVPLLQKYVHDILRNYGNDPRVLMWDLFNEPMNRAKTGTPDFLVSLFAWARQANPGQPLTVAIWSGQPDSKINIVMLAYSDIISYHLYSDSLAMAGKISSLKKYNRPVICTEWMARPSRSSFMKELPLFKSQKVAAYQWGLVNGKTQCQFPWWNKPGGDVDSVYGWFHDILHTDGTPYRQEEIEVIRLY